MNVNNRSPSSSISILNSEFSRISKPKQCDLVASDKPRKLQYASDEIVDKVDSKHGTNHIDFRFPDFVFKRSKRELSTLTSEDGKITENEFSEKLLQTEDIVDLDIECKMISKQDRDGDCILFIAIICKRRDLTLALVNLLNSSSYLNVTNKLFQNALHLAVLIGDHVMVRRLLIGGIEVDKKDRRGNTALHIACDRGLLSIAEAILTPVRYSETTVNRYKAPFRRIPQNLEIRNNEGLTCLHVAAKRKDVKMMKLLLLKNCEINAKHMKDGKTVLHYFCEVGEKKCVEFLLKYRDLNLNARTYSGTSAAEIAKNRGHTQIAGLLLFAGAYQTQCVESSTEFSDSDSE